MKKPTASKDSVITDPDLEAPSCETRRQRPRARIITWARVITTGIVLAGITLVLGFLFYTCCLNHVAVTNIGVSYNSLDGEIKLQPHPGWYVTSPFVRVAHLSTLPMQVVIPSKARIINRKLVRLRPEGAVDFVKLQGFDLQLLSEQENIMLGYAFSGQKYTFLEILEDPAPLATQPR